MKNVAYILVGMMLAGAGVPLAQKLAAQSPAQTRIYIPWMSGSDAGYSTLLQINNTSMDPYTMPTGASGSCTVDAYYNGQHYGPGSLGTIAPGQVNIFTEAQIAAAATGLPLANSGQRAYLFLTCNFKYAHAEALLVNPGGAVSFIPGFIVPANRTLSTAAEQFLQ